MGAAIDIEALTRLASQARKVIQSAVEAGQFGPEFASFPHGSCGSTSEVLAQYLHDAHGLDAKYVCGLKPEHRSHAWVAVDGTVVDITADQFGRDSVIVAETSPWHSEWSAEPPRSPNVSGLRELLKALHEGMEAKMNAAR